MNLNDTAGCFNDYLSIEDNGYEIERFCGRPSNEYAFLSRPGFTKQHSPGTDSRVVGRTARLRCADGSYVWRSLN